MKELLEYAQYTAIRGVVKDMRTADSILSSHVLWKKTQNNKTPSTRKCIFTIKSHQNKEQEDFLASPGENE